MVRKKVFNDVKGYNSRLDELQAAFLRVKLIHLDEWNKRREEIAAYYYRHLVDLPDLILPHIPIWASPIWHIFPIQHPKRDELQKMLKSRGVETLIHYPVPPHLSHAYKDLGYSDNSFPVSNQLLKMF